MRIKLLLYLMLFCMPAFGQMTISQLMGNLKLSEADETSKTFDKNDFDLLHAYIEKMGSTTANVPNCHLMIYDSKRGNKYYFVSEANSEKRLLVWVQGKNTPKDRRFTGHIIYPTTVLTYADQGGPLTKELDADLSEAIAALKIGIKK
jgi:hypothetical protein